MVVLWKTLKIPVNSQKPEMETTSTESKSIKKSTQEQLLTLVQYMEQCPEFARGAPVYGASRQTLDEKWRKLTLKLNSLGPPLRTAVEWKKSWADLKSRTKKKITDNQNSLHDKGAHVYCYNPLTPLEEMIDRTLLLSAVIASNDEAARKKRDQQNIESDDEVTTGGSSVRKRRTVSSLDEVILSPSPAAESKGKGLRDRKTQLQQYFESDDDEFTNDSLAKKQRTAEAFEEMNETAAACKSKTFAERKNHRQHYEDNEDKVPACTPAKKRRKEREQMTLIRRQLSVSERAAATAEMQANSTSFLADAAEKIANAAEKQSEAAVRIAKAAEMQAESAKRSADATEQILMQLQTFMAFNGSISVKNEVE